MKPYSKLITVSLIAGLLAMGSIPGFAQIIRTRSTGNVYITAFAATPDGKYFALGSKSKVEVINAELGEPITNTTTLKPVKAIDLSKDGSLLVISYDSRDASNNLTFWDLSNGFRWPVVHSHKDRILSVAISPDKKLVATGSKDRSIRIFDAKSMQELVTLKGHEGSIRSLKFSPDSRFLLSGSEDRTMKLWDMDKNIDLLTFKAHSGAVSTVAISPDSKYLASGGEDKIITVWDIYDSQKPLATLSGHLQAITSIEFTPDGRFLGSGSKDQQFFIWDYLNEKVLDLHFGTGVNHTDAVDYISFVDNGRLYTCSADKTIKYWNWGFPILEINNFRLSDKNGNQKIEGSEDVKIRFNIENTGDGNALRLKFNISEAKNIEGLTFPREYTIDEIPARGTHEVVIPLISSSKLKSSIAKFTFSNFTVVSNTPFPLRDTSFSIETVATPYLEIDTIYFAKSDTAHFLSGRESGIFKIHLRNNGVGQAKDVRVNIFNDNPGAGLIHDTQADFGNLGVYSSLVLNIPVKASQKTEDGLANFRFEITDASNISTALASYQLITKKYDPTIVEEIKETVERKINEWQKKGKYEKTESYKERVNDKTRQNQIAAFTQQTMDSLVRTQLDWSRATNDYDPDNESFRIYLPGFDPIVLKVPYAEAPEFDRKFSSLKIAGMNYAINARTNKFAFVHLSLADTVSGNRHYNYDSQEFTAFNPTQLDFNFEPVNINIPTSSMAVAGSGEAKRIAIGRSDVDLNIPETFTKNDNIFAVVIGNEDYSSRQTGLGNEINVEFAENDANTFRNYLINTYGVPEENVKLLLNATFAEMSREIKWLANLAESRKGEAELVFYFSGHGLPDENSREGYIIPVDVTGSDIRLAIKLSNLYTELSKWPSKKVTVFLDACFSGGGRDQGLLALKQAKIRPKDETINGNLIVFTSSTGEESSGFYKEKQHGLFTYFLLKKIQETKGSVDYQSLADYLKQEVNLKSLIYNNKPQNPQVIVSNELMKPLNQLKIGSISTMDEE